MSEADPSAAVPPAPPAPQAEQKPEPTPAQPAPSSPHEAGGEGSVAPRPPREEGAGGEGARPRPQRSRFADRIPQGCHPVAEADREPSVAGLFAAGRGVSPVSREGLFALEPLYLRGSSAEEKAKKEKPPG